MAPPSRFRRPRASLVAIVTVGALFTAVLATASPSQAAPTGPCDIYASGGTPCVAAHSTTRALFSAYNGALYQVRRSSDNTTRNIGVLASGVADAAAQDSFCAGTTCVITIIYDQTSRHNDLAQAPGGYFPGPAAGGLDNVANALAEPVMVGGQKAYGVLIPPGTGYRNNNTNGVATGDQPEGMYTVFDGTHYNNGCCFDYGNAERNNRDNGNGTMEALYFGTVPQGYGTGSGPWIMADLENGVYSGVNYGYNDIPSINHRFVTAILKGGPNHWALRGGDAQSGGLSTYFDGPRPNRAGYNPMKKEGAILLGVGGDNSNWSAGTFYEGVMTSGYPSASTENAVQANITAVRYSASGAALGAAVTPGSTISLRATTACCTTRYISHAGAAVNTQSVSASSSATVKADASWIVRTGLGNTGCVSFESRNTPGSYLRHQNDRLYLHANDGTALFAQDATFCPRAGVNGQGNSFKANNYPNRYLRHYNDNLYIADDGGNDAFDAAASWTDDASWVVGPAWAG
jgi:hypothetical protein